MVNMIANLIFVTIWWSMGAIAQGAFGNTDATGSMAASCVLLSIDAHYVDVTRDANDAHNPFTLTLHGRCTIDGQTHDYTQEPHFFHDTALELSRIIANNPYEFLWPVKADAK